MPTLHSDRLKSEARLIFSFRWMLNLFMSGTGTRAIDRSVHRLYHCSWNENGRKIRRIKTTPPASLTPPTRSFSNSRWNNKRHPCTNVNFFFCWYHRSGESFLDNWESGTAEAPPLSLLLGEVGVDPPVVVLPLDVLSLDEPLYPLLDDGGRRLKPGTTIDFTHFTWFMNYLWQRIRFHLNHFARDHP